MNETLKKYLTAALGLALVALGFYTWSLKTNLDTIRGDAAKVAAEVPKQEYKVDTEVTATPKGSSKDPDVIVKQTYTAEVNGKTVTVPVTGGTATTNGTTGHISQTVDMTPVMGLAMAYTKEKYGRKPWEITTGIGVHKDLYIPVGIQRNFNATEGLALEIHTEPWKGRMVTGGELRYSKGF